MQQIPTTKYHYIESFKQSLLETISKHMPSKSNSMHVQKSSLVASTKESLSFRSKSGSDIQLIPKSQKPRIPLSQSDGNMPRGGLGQKRKLDPNSAENLRKKNILEIHRI